MIDPNVMRDITARVRAHNALTMRAHLVRIMPSWDVWPHMLGPISHDPVILRGHVALHPSKEDSTR